MFFYLYLFIYFKLLPTCHTNPRLQRRGGNLQTSEKKMAVRAGAAVLRCVDAGQSTLAALVALKTLMLTNSGHALIDAKRFVGRQDVGRRDG